MFGFFDVLLHSGCGARLLILFSQRFFCYDFDQLIGVGDTHNWQLFADLIYLVIWIMIVIVSGVSTRHLSVLLW